MTIDQRDNFDAAISKLRSLKMAIFGADSIMDDDERDALLGLVAEILTAFEAIQGDVNLSDLTAIASLNAAANANA